VVIPSRVAVQLVDGRLRTLGQCTARVGLCSLGHGHNPPDRVRTSLSLRRVHRRDPRRRASAVPAIHSCTWSPVKLTPTCPAGRSKAVDLKLEVIGIPVSDVDTAKVFYTEYVGF